MEEYKCNILFGAERNLWPNTDYSHLHENKKIPTPYKFLNAGAFCAKPDSFVLHVKEILERGLVGLCDQGNWQIEYLLNSDIELDYNNKLVLNSYLAKDDLIIGDDGIENIQIGNDTVDDATMIDEWLKNSDREFFKRIKEKLEANKAQWDMPKQDIKCSNCGHESKVEVTLDQSNFFVRG